MTSQYVTRGLLEQVVDISVRAGEAILEVYHAEQELEVDIKADDSPVTAADIASHRVLAPALRQLLPNVPVLSEEEEMPSFDQRSRWHRYWIIDPLDGTKEFIKRSGEFTVNVALIEDGVPVLGVVYVPVLGVTYTGIHNQGASKCVNGQWQPIAVRSMAGRGSEAQPVEVVASRNHGAGEADKLIAKIEKRLGRVETKNMGSSLKLCLVAEGAADLYPRLALTCEWDTAAAQAVVEAAGGAVVDSDLKVMRYNSKDNILNPFFHVLGDIEYPWHELLG